MFQPRFLSVETTEHRVAKRHARAKGAGDFFTFTFMQVPFGLFVGEGDGEGIDEAQDVVLVSSGA